MRLTIYNGSPRGKASNSEVISKLIEDNLHSDIVVTKHYIKDVRKHSEIIKYTSDAYFAVFPLYADITPYAVKAFFERMEESKETYKDKPIWFFIHSGFPEAKHSRLLERYLKYFCKLIGANCMGVCIMGSSEVLRGLTNESKRMIKINKNIKGLANNISNSKTFNSKSIEYFKGMEMLPKPVVYIMKLFPNIFNKGFDIMIKRNGAYDKRYDKPYA